MLKLPLTNFHQAIDGADGNRIANCIDEDIAAELCRRVNAERWIPVETLPPVRDKGEQVKRCSEWLVLFLEDDGERRGYYHEGSWYVIEDGTRVPMQCRPTHWKLPSPPTTDIVEGK